MDHHCQNSTVFSDSMTTTTTTELPTIVHLFLHLQSQVTAGIQSHYRTHMVCTLYKENLIRQNGSRIPTEADPMVGNYGRREKCAAREAESE
ncbi:hypothetical protein Dsin_018675 [Dipteronia sinensis]|uniref:Uncharacterized protein n=1 Tax=Dipteronia sinensis TaxID=43782 RepID=A0AAE0E3B4_9ROSI|nr:hypothetical protein Dsin_018675 [Dipteronia sinensis]